MSQERPTLPSVHPQKAGSAESGGISIGGSSVGSVLNTGSHNNIHTTIKLTKIALPSPDSVDILATLGQIRTILGSAGVGLNDRKIGRALDDAEEESQKPQPNKTEVGSALKRALDYAREGGKLAGLATELAPHVMSAVAWLGAHWQPLLATVGLCA